MNKHGAFQTRAGQNPAARSALSRYQSISVDISRYQSVSVDISRYQSISVDNPSRHQRQGSSNCLATCTCYESHRKRMQLRTEMFGTRDATCPYNNFCTPRAKGHRRWVQTGQTQSRLHPPIAPSPQRWFQTGVWEGTPNSSPCPWSRSKFHSEESKIQCNSHSSRHGAQAESSMNFQIGIPSSSTCPCSHNNCHSEGNKRQCGSRYSTLHVARRNGRNGLRLVQQSHSSRSTTWFHAEQEVLPRLMPNRTECNNGSGLGCHGKADWQHQGSWLSGGT